MSMKSWQIHFAWAIVTAVACAITWRAASRQEPPSAPPPVAVRVEPRAAAAAPSTGSPDVVPVSDVLAAQSTKPAAPASPVDRMRGLIKSSQNWDEFREVTALLPDRATKLQLAKEALAGDNPYAISWAMMLLRELKGRESAELLEGVLKTHRQNDIRATAADALGDVRDPGSLGPLTDALESKSRNVKISSAGALKKMGYAAPSAALMETLVREFESTDGSIRRTTVEWMMELDAPAALPTLMRALKDVNGDVRMAAIDALQAVEGLNYLEILGPLVDDPNPDVARRARDFVEEFKKLEK